MPRPVIGTWVKSKDEIIFITEILAAGSLKSFIKKVLYFKRCAYLYYIHSALFIYFEGQSNQMESSQAVVQRHFERTRLPSLVRPSRDPPRSEGPLYMVHCRQLSLFHTSQLVRQYLH